MTIREKFEKWYFDLKNVKTDMFTIMREMKENNFRDDKDYIYTTIVDPLNNYLRELSDTFDF